MSPKPIAKYVLAKFVEDCGDKNSVFVSKGARETAQKDFGLNTEMEVLEFIANDGLEDATLENSVPWRNNPKPEKEIYVDSYEFSSGRKLGYIAFLFGHAGKWIVKSFKLSDKQGPQTHLGELLSKALDGPETGPEVLKKEVKK